MSTVVPVSPLALSPSAATGAPCWAARRFPAASEQQLEAWAAAISDVLLGQQPQQYLANSRACRDAALQHVGQGPMYFQAFLSQVCNT